MSYIVDTDIIKSLTNGTIHLEDLPSDHPLVAARAQIEQIRRTGDKSRKARLLLKFGKCRLKRVSLGSIILDGSHREALRRWDSALFRELTDEFRRRCHSRSNARDMLLAEVAITNGLTFLTGDECLADVVRRHGGEAVHFHTRH